MDFQIGERGIKNCKQNYTIPHAESAFELVHTTVPNGEKKTPEHAAGTNRKEKNPQIATGESTLHAQGQTNKPQERKFQTTGISSGRERKGVYQDEDVEIRAPLEMVQWNKPPSGDVKYQDKTHQT